MLGMETILLVIVYSQPLILGLLMVCAIRPRVVLFSWLVRNLSSRHRSSGARFFECAAYPRLVGWLRFGTQALTLCAFFLLYDLDLVFFFSEVTHFEMWAWSDFVLVVTYLLFFLAGVFYDLWRCGLMWS